MHRHAKKYIEIQIHTYKYIYIHRNTYTYIYIHINTSFHIPKCSTWAWCNWYCLMHLPHDQVSQRHGTLRGDLAMASLSTRSWQQTNWMGHVYIYIYIYIYLFIYIFTDLSLHFLSICLFIYSLRYNSYNGISWYLCFNNYYRVLDVCLKNHTTFHIKVHWIILNPTRSKQ